MASHNDSKEHFTQLIRNTMEAPAWRGLSSTAQALYPWLKLEWRGARYNNNGKIRLSTRQAAQKLGVSTGTAANAFQDLQAKGFIYITTPARLGIGGEAKSPAYEITEIAMTGTNNKPRKLYINWKPGHDYPVNKHMANNPNGYNGKTKPCPNNHDSAVLKMRIVKQIPT